MRAKNYLVLLYGSKMTWFCLQAENDLFLVWLSIDLVLVWVVEMDLVFSCGPEIAWCQCEHRN